MIPRIARKAFCLQVESIDRETIAVFIVRIIGILLTLSCLAFLARYLGAKTYGQYIYVFNWLEILTAIGLLGLNQTALRFVPAYRSQSDWGLLRGFISRSGQTVLTASCLTGIIAAVIVGFLKGRLEDGLIPIFWIGLVSLPLIALIQLIGAFLQGIRRAALSLIPQVFRPLALVIGILVLGDFLGYGLGASSVFGLEAFVNIILLFLMWRLLLNSMSRHRHSEAYRIREWLTVSIPILLISLMNILLARIDIMMLGTIQGTIFAGYYSAASRIAAFVIFGLTTINFVMAPRISELFTQRRQSELQRNVTLFAWTTSLFAFLMGVIIIILGPFILRVFGSEFVVAYQALVILTIGQFINALSGPVGYLMTMTRYQNEAAAILLISTILNIVLNALLIPYYGLTGSAVATAGSLVFWNLAMAILAKRRLGINSTIFSIGNSTGRR